MRDYLDQVENVPVLIVFIAVGRATHKMGHAIPGFEAQDCIRAERKPAQKERLPSSFSAVPVLYPGSQSSCCHDFPASWTCELK